MRCPIIKNGLRPIHPGEILREEFVEPLGLSANALARRLDVPATRLHEILKERRAITADTALRLARCFGTTAEFWMALQADYDLKLTRQVKTKEISTRVEPLPQQVA